MWSQLPTIGFRNYIRGVYLIFYLYSFFNQKSKQQQKERDKERTTGYNADDNFPFWQTRHPLEK